LYSVAANCDLANSVEVWAARVAAPCLRGTESENHWGWKAALEVVLSCPTHCSKQVS